MRHSTNPIQEDDEIEGAMREDKQNAAAETIITTNGLSQLRLNSSINTLGSG